MHHEATWWELAQCLESCWVTPTATLPFMRVKCIVCIFLFYIELSFLYYISLDCCVVGWLVVFFSNWKYSNSHFIVFSLTWFQAMAKTILFSSVMCESLLTLKTLHCLHKELVLFIEHKAKGCTKTIIVIIQYLQTNSFSDTKQQNQLLP